MGSKSSRFSLHAGEILRLTWFTMLAKYSNHKKAQTKNMEESTQLFTHH